MLAEGAIKSSMCSIDLPGLSLHVIEHMSDDGSMSTASLYLPPATRSLGNELGDAVPAPRDLMDGPGRSWRAEPQWTQAQIRIGGHWRQARVERWRLRVGSIRWVAQITWQADTGQRVGGWYVLGPGTALSAVGARTRTDLR